MKLNKPITASLIISASVLITACSDNDSDDKQSAVQALEAAEVNMERGNIELVDTALTGFFVNGDPAFADQYIAEDYIQHNPLGMNGRDFVKSIFIDGRPDDLQVEMPFYMADGDFVLQHSRFTGFTAFYERPIIAVDVYRIQDGMMVEHWDIVQQEVYANETVSGNAMFPIIQSTEVVSEAQEDLNAELVRSSIDHVINGDGSLLETYFANDYINHSPNSDNGLEALKAFSKESMPEGATFEIGFVIADGPYVAVQTRSAGVTSVPVISFDIYRIEDNKIAEHWDVVQDEVPVEATQHGNAMFPIVI